MRILIVCKKFPYPAKDGETIVIFNHIKGFSSAGHQVTVASINTAKHHVNVSQLPKAVTGMAEFHAVDADTSLKLLKALGNLFRSDSYHISRFVLRAFEDKLKVILSENKFDVIQLEGLFLAPYVAAIRSCSEAVVVMRAHNVEFEIWERISREISPGLKKWYFAIQAARLKKFEASVLNSYDAMVPITSRDAGKFRALGCTLPMRVSPAGIQINDYKIDYSKTEFPSVFYLGGLDWIPNQEGLKWFVEKVWRKVLESFPSCKFYIAGRNAPGWIKSLKEKNTVVIGEVDDARAFMNSKAIMVVPLFSGSGMRVKIVEGMAMGKAIISTAIGAEGIDYADGENIIIANTPEEFIGSINRCAGSWEYSLRLGSSAVDFARKNYDNGILTSSLLKFYSELKTK